MKKNDLVVVIAGDDRGKTGRIKDVNAKKGLVIVEGVALAVKHYKAKRNGETSSKKIIEKYIHISNVALISAA